MTSRLAARRHLVVVAAAVAAVAVSAAVLIARDPSGVTVGTGAGAPGGTGPVGTGTRLVVPKGDEGGRLLMQVVDVDSGATTVSSPSSLGAAAMWRPVARDGGIVVVDSVAPAASNVRAAWVFDDPMGPPRPLTSGHVALDAFASTEPDRVWLVAYDGPAATAGRVWEVDLSGAVTTPEARFPEGRVPVAAVTGGLVRERRTEDYGVGLEVWDPRSGEVVRPIAERDAFLLDAAGARVAWLSGSDGLHVTDVASGTNAVVSRPSDSLAFSTYARFSPDGRRLAVDMVDVAAVGAAVPPLIRFATDQPFPGQVALVDVEAATAVTVPGSRTSGAEWRRNLAWSPAGDWLFLGRSIPSFGPAPGTLTALRHRPGSSASVELGADLHDGPILTLPPPDSR